MQLSVLLGVIATLITLITFVFYNKDVLKGDIGPTMPSWLLWSVITVINTATFKFVSGDWLTTSTILTDCLGGVFTTCAIFYQAFRRGISIADFFKGLWKSMDVWQRRAAVISGLSLLAWANFRSASVANAMVLLGYAAAFVPTYGTVRADPRKEKPAPWFAWTFAHILILFVVILSRQATPMDFLAPTVYALLHAGVGILACRRSTQQKSETT